MVIEIREADHIKRTKDLGVAKQRSKMVKRFVPLIIFEKKL